MQNLELNEYLTLLYQKLFSRDADENVLNKMNTIVEDNGLKKGCPEWLISLFSALINGDEYGDTHVPFSVFNSDNFDVSNFLAELEFYLQFPITDYGEYTLLSFAQIGRWVLINKETVAGDVCIKMSSNEKDFAKYV